MSATRSSSLLVRVPWGPSLGLARTFLAAGTAGTLALSDTNALFATVLGRGQAPYCDGPSGVGVFCVLPREQLSLARWACVAVLLVVASGWRPPLTAIPHWWIAFSVNNNISIPDGGDQITQVLTLLLIPVLLSDRRRWHWEPAPTAVEPGWPVAIGACAIVAIRLQVAAVYFHAAVAKLGQPEWVDGTAMYYWLRDRSFGPAPWLRPFTDWLVDRPSMLALVTWGPVAIELLLALSVLLRQAVRWALLPLAFALHLSIALVMGLWSFSLAMLGACVLLLAPAASYPTEGLATALDRVSRTGRRHQRVPEPSNA